MPEGCGKQPVFKHPAEEEFAKILEWSRNM
jgi:hypothetical protein